MAESNSTIEKSEASNGESEHEHVCDIEAMPDDEFWQRVALEAVVNDDPAKALSLRVEAFFSDAKCLPRQRNTLRIIGVGCEELFEWMITPTEFECDTIEEDTQGVIVRGIEYSQFEGEFSPEGDR